MCTSCLCSQKLPCTSVYDLERTWRLQFASLTAIFKKDPSLLVWFIYFFNFCCFHPPGSAESQSHHTVFWDSLEPSPWAVPPADKPGGSGGVVLNEVRIFLLTYTTISISRFIGCFFFTCMMFLVELEWRLCLMSWKSVVHCLLLNHFWQTATMLLFQTKSC